IEWVRINAKGKPQPQDCPAKIAAFYMSRVGFWNLPELVGIIEAPILRPDGTVLTASGHDHQTGLYLNSSTAWSGMPEHPTRSHAQNAVGILIKPFSQFPFVADEDRSVLVAGILTALQRRLLMTAPLFGFSAPSQRSGKSLLVESIGMITTGRKPAAAGLSK